MSKNKKHFRYTDCGLDYIYLVNGYETSVGPDGEKYYSIKHADTLHKKIAEIVVRSPNPMRGQELRFLRSILDLSQAGIAKLLGNTRPTIARWEAEKNTPIDPTADRFLRVFYELEMDGHAQDIKEMLQEIDEDAKEENVCLQRTNSGWRLAA